MEHRESEAKYPLEMLLKGIERSPLFIRHLLVDLKELSVYKQPGTEETDIVFAE